MLTPEEQSFADALFEKVWADHFGLTYEAVRYGSTHLAEQWKRETKRLCERLATGEIAQAVKASLQHQV